jgi:hypothetical protein
MKVSLLVETDVAGIPENNTAVAPVNPEPMIATMVPPAAGPVFGETLDTLMYDGSAYVKWSAVTVALVP